jgi:hypothetical protein
MLNFAEPGSHVAELAQRDAGRLMRNRGLVRVRPTGKQGLRPRQCFLWAGQSERQ